MNVEQSMCAASGLASQWERIDWSQCEQRVRRLQARIVKATQEGRHGKVKALQWLLTPLVLRPSVGCKAGDEQSGQEYAGSGRIDLEHSRVQIQGHRHTASARLSAATAAACLYPEGQWEAETAWNPHDEGSLDAGTLPARAAPNRGDDCRSQLLWFSTGTLNRRCHRAMLLCACQ